jgi:hypothetical protein
MSKLFLQYTESRSGGGISDGQEDEDWPSHDPEYTEIELGNLLLTERMTLNGDFIEAINFDPIKYINKPLYIIHVRYSTGNTFGRSNGWSAFPGCFASFEEASELEKQIRNKEYRGYCPWEGYFEYLESVDIVVKQLLDGKK